jgi:L-seryl-tRNA(Ser) seleniumtransferase
LPSLSAGGGDELDIYDELEVRKFINGNATLTRLGGSVMPPVVLAAMAEASRHFVDIDELQEKAGRRLAEITRNEAAYVSCGAAAGMVLATAACIAGKDPEKRGRLPETSGMANEVVVHRHGRVEYDFAIRQTGGRLIEIGSLGGAEPQELETAISERTAALFYFYNPARMERQLPLETGIEIAHSRGIPVVVDAAAQLPPVENLWRFTAMGADLALFSGGKGLCGPQSSGLIVGRRELIEACAFHAMPRHFIGRPMKVGKEEIIGLLAAVQWYLGLDHDALMRQYEEQVAYIVDRVSAVPGLTARRSFPSEAGQPMPRAEILLKEGPHGIDRDEVLSRLERGTPPISLAPSGETGIYVNPQTLRHGEERVVVDRILEIVGSGGGM